MGFFDGVKQLLRGNPQSGATLDVADAAPDAVGRNRPKRLAPPHPPLRRSIGNKTYRVPPTPQNTSDGTRTGGGGPGNSGAAPAGKRVQPTELDVQPSWHWESQYEYIGHARPANTPHTAGIRANDFRTLGDLHGGRQ